MKKNKYAELTALKGKMRENKITYRVLAKDMGISLNTLNSKINGHSSFNLDEVIIIVDRLDIESDEITRYFFPSMLRNAVNNINPRYKN